MREVLGGVLCVLSDGPWMICVSGQTWCFEWHHYCGPIVVNYRNGNERVQPPSKSPFWDAVVLWDKQGRRTYTGKGRYPWAKWDPHVCKFTTQVIVQAKGEFYDAMHCACGKTMTAGRGRK